MQHFPVLVMQHPSFPVHPKQIDLEVEVIFKALNRKLNICLTYSLFLFNFDLSSEKLFGNFSHSLSVLKLL